MRFGPGTTIEVLPPQASGAQNGFSIIRGLLSFFGRDKPGRFRIVTPGADAGVNGTEFVVKVEILDGVENTTISVIDGEVKFTSGQSPPRVLRNNQQSVAEKDKPPSEPKGFIANNVLQWSLYYPAVLDLRDLPLAVEEEQALSESLAAYRQGGLLQALQKYPPERHPSSDAERLYYASLLLSVGDVQKTESILDDLPAADPSERLQRLAAALRQLIAAVKFQTAASSLNPQLSTEFLAASYYAQSRTDRKDSLELALHWASEAATNSPAFGFAWARVAELEFSFGHTRRALEALNRSLNLATNNVQALSLKGFLLAAQNEPFEAIGWFNQAITADSGLGNAWLGRGLCRIRRGDIRGGRADLLVAAALEPQRALLRSYLGKAYGDAGDFGRASHELNLAEALDWADPTAWLYSALLGQQENRINEAIADLEASQQRNENRRLFRSRLLLDEDRAVRSANLASIYRDAGMTDVGVREAARAVTYDYANDSAHLFLSDSYNELRDPTRFNLRYETVWFNELLLANLLSPVGGGRLSQHVSQQEYSRLLQADGLGIANSTLGRSDNKSITELVSQFGTFGRTSYALDLDYEHHRGVRPNNDLDDIEWYTTVKQQITPQDTALMLVKYEDYHSGDNFQYYDPLNPTNGFRPHFRFEEYQHPITVGGWHHEWSPGMHTLLLAGRLENDQHFNDRATPQLLFLEFSNGQIANQIPGAFDVDYHSGLETYTAELNQIFQWKGFTLSAGGRYQSGTYSTRARLDNPSGAPLSFFNGTPTNTASTDDFQRFTGYSYLTVEPLDRLWLTAGLAYDDISYPRNFRNPPVSSGQDHRSQFGPKAAVLWEPGPHAALRGIFTRSLGGVSLDESYRLEPTQLAGFPQTYRTLISESVAGSVSAPEFQIYGLALDLKFPFRTYAGVHVGRLESKVRRSIGLFVAKNGIVPPFLPDSTLERLDYFENSLDARINQLIGDSLVVGASYKFTDVELRDVLPSIPVSAFLTPPQTVLRAKLHEATGYLLFNHPSGFFARAESQWYHQGSSTPLGYSAPVAGDDFFQENLFVGYRFAHRHAELLLGIMNLSGQDYHLNPLTVYAELPRERALIARLKFEF